MMDKPKLFVWCDSPTVSTGFGIVAKNLLADLHKTYDVYILGINYFGMTPYDKDKWFIYSVETGDPIGIKRFEQTLLTTKPDLILLFQDIFHIDMMLAHVFNHFPKVPVIAYYPIDGHPISSTWLNMLRSRLIKKHFIYSEFSEREIKAVYPDFANYEILYHGVDPNAFYKLPDEKIDEIRAARKWSDRFVIINVNRFQPRKYIMGTLRAVSLLRHGYKKCDCGNYYLLDLENCDLNGCDIDHVLDVVEPKDDVTLYMHMAIMEQTMGPMPATSLAGHAWNVGWNDHDTTVGRNLFYPDEENVGQKPISESELNELYNAANINLTTTLGEGFGLNLVEASICGTTTIAPNNSAIPEIIRDTGYLIRNDAFYTQAMDNSHLRPLVSLEGVVDALEIEYAKWVANGRKKIINTAAIENARTRFMWEDKKIQLERALAECLQGAKNGN